MGFDHYLGIATVNEAEIWGLYNGLQLAWNAGCRRLIVKLDSQVVIQLLNKDLPEIHPLRVLIVCCQQMLNKEWIVKFNMCIERVIVLLMDLPTGVFSRD